MPWPPTGWLQPLSLSEQISAPVTPGLESATADPAAGLMPADGQFGVVAPGVLSPENDSLDALFDSLPAPDEQRLQAPDSSKRRDLVIQYAKEKLGWNYVWGGESDAEGGYDCSGLLYYAFKKAGIDMPRVSYAQTGRGKRVGIGKLRPGDLVAWDSNPDIPGADHIALYLGNGKILEAPRTGLKVRVRDLGKNEGAWGIALDY